MPSRRPRAEIANYGQYTPWNKTSSKLPKLIKYTETIESEIGNEFGIVINVDDAKGKILEFIIKHPPIQDKNGNLRPNFKGELYVNSHHTQFFIGEGLFEPIENMLGEWIVIIYMDKKEVIKKKFTVL